MLIETMQIVAHVTWTDRLGWEHNVQVPTFYLDASHHGTSLVNRVAATVCLAAAPRGAVAHIWSEANGAEDWHVNERHELCRVTKEAPCRTPSTVR